MFVKQMPLITIKGFVRFNMLYDEYNNSYKLINRWGIKGIDKIGYFQIKPITDEYWFILRELILEQKTITY